MSPARQRRIIVAGTDTGVGKTVFAAALTHALDAYYWKPIQAGSDAASAVALPSPVPGEGRDVGDNDTEGRTSDTDRETVLQLSGLSADRVLPEAYRLKLPAAPSIAAAAEGVTIDRTRLADAPAVADGRPLVIELAGGLLVPLAPGVLQIDLVADWLHGAGGGVVLVARTALGTINHTLLSLEALRARRLPVIGVAFVGDAEPAAEREIMEHGRVPRLGRLPRLARLDAGSLAGLFVENFEAEEFMP